MTIVRSAFLEYSYIALIILGEIDVFSDFKFRSFVLNFIKKNFVWVLVGLGMAPLCFLVYYFCVGGYVRFDPILRSDAIDWASVGSMAAGCFTGMAAFFTLATLMHLINQKKAEDILRNFELCRKHKEEFYALCKHLEQSSNFRISFKHPYELYRALFPTNNTSATTFVAETEREFIKKVQSYLQEFNNDIKYFSDRYDKLTFESFEHEKQFSCLTVPLKNLFEHLEIEMNLREGDIFYRERTTCVNLFTYEKDLSTARYICDELFSFAGIRHNVEPLAPDNWGIKRYFTFNGLLLNPDVYRLQFTYCPQIYTLFKVYSILYQYVVLHASAIVLASQKELRNFICENHMFFQRFEKLLSREDLKDAFESGYVYSEILPCRKYLSEIIKHIPFSDHKSKIEECIRLITDLEYDLPRPPHRTEHS